MNPYLSITAFPARNNSAGNNYSSEPVNFTLVQGHRLAMCVCVCVFPDCNAALARSDVRVQVSQGEETGPLRFSAPPHPTPIDNETAANRQVAWGPAIGCHMLSQTTVDYDGDKKESSSRRHKLALKFESLTKQRSNPRTLNEKV